MLNGFFLLGGISMFDLTTLLGIHTDISLVAILTGIVAIAGLLKSRVTPIWNEIFLLTAVLTSATGFLLPSTKLLPSHIVGIVALAVLAIALLALYAFKLRGAWRWIYTTSAVFSLYFLVFVAVAQAFGKVPSLKAIAPTQSEPPFLVAQGALLLVFIIGGFVAQRRFARTA